MPNWCNNYVELQHTDATMISRAATAFGKGQLLNEFVPVPDELHIVAGNVGAKDSPEQVAHELQVERNIARHGYANWWDFCVAEWGTKWDVGSEGDSGTISESGKKLVISFDSAWAPPVAAYEKLEELGFTVKAYYYEGGMGFAGVYSDGYDNYFEFDCMSSDEVADMLPGDLDEIFNISAQIAEFEEEENLEIDLDGGVSAVNE